MNSQRNQKTMRKKRSMELLILGWSFVVIGIIVAIWGFIEIPASSWWGTEFLAFAIGGITFIAGGLTILKMPGWLVAIATLIAALLVILFIWKSQMELAAALICYVIVAALVLWLLRLILK